VDTLREIAPHLSLEDEVAWLAETELADTDGLIALPGALDALNDVADNRRAVVTSGGRELARMRLRHTGLPVPDVLIAAEDVRVGKPSSEGYELAAARLGIETSRCLVIEDTPAGISGGRAAGATVLAVATTFPADALAEADLVVASLTAVHLRQIGNGIELTMASGGR
jgi:sugar-phosphatase